MYVRPTPSYELNFLHFQTRSQGVMAL